MICCPYLSLSSANIHKKKDFKQVKLCPYNIVCQPIQKKATYVAFSFRLFIFLLEFAPYRKRYLMSIELYLA